MTFNYFDYTLISTTESDKISHVTNVGYYRLIFFVSDIKAVNCHKTYSFNYNWNSLGI